MTDPRIRLVLDPPLARVILCGIRHLDSDLIESLDRAWDSIEAHDGVRVILIENTGPDFMIGVDTPWVVERMRDDDFASIETFVRQGQAWMRRVDLSRARVFARVRGLATGAGAELLAACDGVIATADARIGLPETGLGIHPAFGGTQRLPRRIGFAATRWLVLTGTYIGAEAAQRLGWVDVVSGETLASGLSSMESAPRAATIELAAESSRGLSPEFELAFRTRTLEELEGGPRRDDSPELRRALARLARRAPVALRVADRLLREATRCPLETGLDREVEELATVYATEDAGVGLRAGAAGRRAARFSGR